LTSSSSSSLLVVVGLNRNSLANGISLEIITTFTPPSPSSGGGSDLSLMVEEVLSETMVVFDKCFEHEQVLIE